VLAAFLAALAAFEAVDANSDCIASISLKYSFIPIDWIANSLKIQHLQGGAKNLV